MPNELHVTEHDKIVYSDGRTDCVECKDADAKLLVHSQWGQFGVCHDCFERIVEEKDLTVVKS